MRSDDLTTTARIRQTALELFAVDGVEATTVRAIAAKAEVSPALILHHFGSKAALAEAVDRYVIDVTAEIFDAFAGRGPDEQGVKALLRFTEHPDLMEYLSRSIVAGAPAGNALFDQMADLSVAALAKMRAAGTVRDVDDPEMVSLFLLAADLGMMLLRRHMDRHLGCDVMSPDGMARWATAELDVLSKGLLP